MYDCRAISRRRCLSRYRLASRELDALDFKMQYLTRGLNRGAYEAPVTLTNSLRSLSFLETRDCRRMAEMSGNKIPEETEKARTIAKFLEKDISSAIKRERREVQNSVDMDRVVDSGDVSLTVCDTIIRLWPSPRAECRAIALPSAFAVPVFSFDTKRSSLKYHYIPFISNDHDRDPRAMYYCIVIGPRGITWYVPEHPQQFDATRITRK